MANFEEFTIYKQTLMKEICTSEAIVNLMKLDSDPSTITGKDMRYKRIYPYNHVPLTIETAQTFICFTVTAPNIKDKLITELRLTVYVFTHQDLMRTDNGMRTDLIISEIDKLLNRSKNYGLGEVTPKMCDVMQVPCQGYTGLFSVYSVKDFNYSICKGNAAWL